MVNINARGMVAEALMFRRVDVAGAAIARDRPVVRSAHFRTIHDDFEQ
jgi:hypothetical protein